MLDKLTQPAVPHNIKCYVPTSGVYRERIKDDDSSDNDWTKPKRGKNVWEKLIFKKVITSVWKLKWANKFFKIIPDRHIGLFRCTEKFSEYSSHILYSALLRKKLILDPPMADLVKVCFC